MNSNSPRLLRVAAILDETRGPAVRFRFHQLAPYLEQLGIDLERWCTPELSIAPVRWRPAREISILANFALRGALKVPGLLAASEADLAIVSRQLVQGIPYFERALRGRWILDVDDALWEARPWGFSAARDAAKRAAAVVTGNPFLAQWYRQHNSFVRVIPTSVDTIRYSPVLRQSGPFVVGWIGSSSNLPFLEARNRVLKSFLEARPDTRLLVISDKQPSLSGIPEGQFEFRKWAPEIEVQSIQQMSVGLMPLPVTDVARGKSAAKLLTYAACGVPCIASPVGINADILQSTELGWAPTTDDEWLDSLIQAFQNPELSLTRGRRGRQLVESHYSAKAAAGSWAELLREVHSR